jgi:hypothetical protein
VIIECLVFLAAQIAADITAAAFTFGASTAAIPAEEAAARFTILSVIRSAVFKLVSHMVESIASQVVFTFFAQFIEYCQGRRKSFDGSQIATSAENGAIGGAIGFGMGGLGKGLGKLGGKIPLPNSITNLPDPVKNFATGTGKALGAIGWGAISGTAEASGQDAAAGSFGDEIAGAENGAFSGGYGKFHEWSNPDDALSLSMGKYLDNGLNKMFPPTKVGGSEPPTTPPTPEPDSYELPPLNLPPADDWTGWAEGYEPPSDTSISTGSHSSPVPSEPGSPLSQHPIPQVSQDPSVTTPPHDQSDSEPFDDWLTWVQGLDL